MPGAPQILGTAIGGFLSAMDILVDGMDERSGSISVASGTATLTFSGGAHAAIQHAVILVSGSGDVNLNGEQKVLTSTATEITFPTNAANGTYACTFKLAPMGWERPFTGTNKRVYRSLDVTTEQIYLRLEQPTAQYANVRCYRSMTGVDTGTGIFPDTTTVPTFAWPIRTNAGATTGSPYIIATDGKRFFFYNETFFNTANQYAGGVAQYFGPIISRPEIIDANNTLVSGSTTTALQVNGIMHVGGSNAKEYLSKEFTGIGDFKTATFAIAATTSTSWASGFNNSWGGSYPDPVTGALISSEIYVLGVGSSASSAGVRGKIPGLKLTCQDNAGIFQTGNEVEIDGRVHFSARTASNTTTPAVITRSNFIDIEGPWE